MDQDIKRKIVAYIENQIARGEVRLEAWTVDDKGEKLPKRSAYLILNKHLREFTTGKTEPRWLAVPGLRGTGKTTLLAQLYTELRCKRGRKIYISLDEVVRTLGVSLTDILVVYEEIIGSAFENLDEPVYLFLDEVQYEPNWGVTLKTIYDRSKKVFIVCTGSSALSLQTNADIARRVIFIKLYPLNFVEFLMIKKSKYPVGGLADNLRKVLFNSETAGDVYSGLSQLAKSVNSYWANIDRLEIDTFLKYGTLPFALRLSQEPLIFAQINQTLNNVLTKDVPQLNKFDKSTIDRLNQILYAVSSSDIISFNNIAKLIGIDVKTVISVFNALEKTEVLVRIYPYGTHYGQVRKPSKYLFTSPAYRAMYHNLVGSTVSYDGYKGKLLEDVAGVYLHRIFSRLDGSSLTYDTSSSGADFIIGVGTRLEQPIGRIVLEVSMKEKDYGQVIRTLEKVDAKYGLVVSSGELGIDRSNRCVSVPLRFFLLI